MDNLKSLEPFINLGGVFLLSVIVIFIFYQLMKEKNKSNSNNETDKYKDVNFILERMNIVERFSVMETKINNFEKQLEIFEKRMETHIQNIYTLIKK